MVWRNSKTPFKMKIDLPAHYGFASLPSTNVTPGEGGSAITGEGGDPTFRLMLLQRLNSKIGGGPGEGGVAVFD